MRDPRPHAPGDTDPGPQGRDPLRPDRARFVELRASGETVEGCAAKLGVDRSTCFRWLLRAEVRAALADAQGEGRTVAAGILATHAPRAAEVLGEALADPDASVRVRAANAVLDRIGLRGEDETTDDGETALVLGDGTIILGGTRYRPEGETPHDGDQSDGGDECESE